jgi:hypothetical protein
VVVAGQHAISRQILTGILEGSCPVCRCPLRLTRSNTTRAIVLDGFAGPQEHRTRRGTKSDSGWRFQYWTCMPRGPRSLILDARSLDAGGSSQHFPHGGKLNSTSSDRTLKGQGKHLDSTARATLAWCKRWHAGFGSLSVSHASHPSIFRPDVVQDRPLLGMGMADLTTRCTNPSTRHHYSVSARLALPTRDEPCLRKWHSRIGAGTRTRGRGLGWAWTIWLLDAISGLQIQMPPSGICASGPGLPPATAKYPRCAVSTVSSHRLLPARLRQASATLYSGTRKF